eukprot:UN11599
MKNYIFPRGYQESQRGNIHHIQKIQNCLEQHFDVKNVSNHCIDFMEELMRLYQQILYDYSHAHAVYFCQTLGNLMYSFLRNNECFGQMMINELNKNRKRTLKFVLKAFECDEFSVPF